MRTLMYAGKPLSDFHVVWDGSKEFDKPKKIANSYTIPYRNGNLIKSTESFENVSISYPCFIRENFEENYSELVNYLNSFDTYQRLESTEEPSIYRMAFLHSVITPKTSAFNQGGMFTITFDCMPQEWLKSGEAEMSIDMQTTTYTDPVEVDIDYDDALVDNAVLTLSPVQDLNGQEYPWVDKVGRNKLNLVNMAKTETVNGITFTLTDEGKIYMNGTQDGSTTVTMWFPFASIETIPYGTYKISGLPSNMTFGDYGFSTIDSDQHITEHYENNSEVTDTIINFGVWVYEGVTLDNVELKPMVRESTDTSDVWQPYEHTTNICPIYPANGKNLLNWQNTSQTVNGVTFTVNADGTVVVNGTATADASLYATSDTYYSLSAGSYILSGCPSGGSSTTYMMNETVNFRTDVGNGVTLTLDADTRIRFRILIKNGYTANNLVFKPMIRRSNESSDFVPYQGVMVEQTGKNLLNQSDFVQGSINGNTGANLTSNTRLRSPFVTVESGKTYTVQCNSELLIFEMHRYDAYKNWLGYTLANRVSRTFTVDSDTRYMKFLVRKSDNSVVTVSELTAFQLEEGEATAYEPYQSNTYYSNLGQFVYGGTVDLVTGVLTVTHKLVDMGSLTWNRTTAYSHPVFYVQINEKGTKYEGAMSSAFRNISSSSTGSAVAFANVSSDGDFACSPNNAQIFVRYDQYTTPADFKTAVTGYTLVYPLASPQTYYLSAQDIALLQGKNYFTAEQPLSVTITEGTTLTNPSYMKARPIIKLNNAGTGTVKLNGDVVVRVTEAPSNVPIYIDCENMNCYSYDEDGNVVNENGNVTLPEGYIEMEKGNNRFTATGQLEPTMIPRWWRL